MKQTFVLISLGLTVAVVVPCVAQQAVTLGLESEEGLTIDAPQGYTPARYSFGSLPVRNGEPAQGLTVALSASEGLVFYGPPVDTGPGEVLVECTVWCTGPDVALALVAMNLPDYSMMANLPANGEEYMGGWQTMRLIYNPKDDSLMLGFQVVSTANPDTDVPSIVYIDEITVTPLNSLTREEAGALLGVPVVDTPTPTPTPTHTETAVPTAPPLSIDTHTSGVTSVAFSHDGAGFLTAGKDRTAKLWDAATGELLTTFSGHKGVLRAADITPDGQFVVTASSDTTARVWNAGTGQYIRKFTSHRAPVLALAISPTGDQVLTGGGDDNARLWDPATVQEIQVFSGHREDVTSVAFSSDGQRVLTGSADWTATLWNRETGEAIRSFVGHLGGVTGVALSSDGSRVFTASEDGSARVWDASSGETIAVLEDHDSAVRALALTSDNAWLLTGGEDQSVKLWHVGAGAVRHTSTGHSGAVNGVAFSPDGGKGLSGSEDGTVQLWALSESYTTPTPTSTPTLTHTPTPTYTPTPTPTETATPGPGLDDGFESGDLLSAGWSTTEYQGWFVTTDDAASGDFSARTGQIFDGQSSTIEILVSVTADWRGAALVFQRRVSSEVERDYLNFYIDDVLQDRWSGEVPWEEVRYAIEPGVHTLRWTYAKDGQIKSGEDAAYIDDVILLTETVTAGLDVLGGFEEGYFAGDIWNSPTNIGWTVTSENVHLGQFSARSGRITDGQSTTLETTITVAPGQVGFISFLLSVSCEAEYDYLSFSIDGTEKGRWSGEVPWAPDWHSVASGTHTLRWTYTKDFSNGHGQDAAYIDEVWFSQGSGIIDTSGSTAMVILPSLLEGAKPLEIVLLPAGTFTMGSPTDEQDRESDETQHVVTISQPFYIGAYEVTQAQWEALMGGNPSHNAGNPNHPVENVSWNDCQDFILALNALVQGTFRLPTEAEWEYACRAGTTTRFYWGEDPQGAYEWYFSNSGQQSQPVGQKLPNPWGLYDMGGNVLEWCLDWYGDYPSGSVTDPSGPASGTGRVLRSNHIGGWTLVGSADRRGHVPDLRDKACGLRVVREYP